jgi:hypothetical protein
MFQGQVSRYSVWDFTLAKAAALRVNLNIDGAPITSRLHTHPSHSQVSRLLNSSLSLGVPVPSTTEWIRECRFLNFSFYPFITPKSMYSFLSLGLVWMIHNKHHDSEKSESGHPSNYNRGHDVLDIRADS